MTCFRLLTLAPRTWSSVISQTLSDLLLLPLSWNGVLNTWFEMFRQLSSELEGCNVSINNLPIHVFYSKMRIRASNMETIKVQHQILLTIGKNDDEELSLTCTCVWECYFLYDDLIKARWHVADLSSHSPNSGDTYYSCNTAAWLFYFVCVTYARLSDSGISSNITLVFDSSMFQVIDSDWVWGL